ncbi:MAG: hypothetical protein V1767_00695 [Chloroflexota bacterium]
MFTPEQEKEYLDNSGGKCPVCGSENIVAYGGMDFDGNGTASEKVQCNNCGAKWYDIYNLIGIQQINDEDEQPIPLILTQTDNEDDSGIDFKEVKHNG